MKDGRVLLTGIAAALAATVSAGLGTARADQHLLVLLDASGSMIRERGGDATTPTRWDAARKAADDAIADYAATEGAVTWVALYAFAGSSLMTPLSHGVLPEPIGNEDPWKRCENQSPAPDGYVSFRCAQVILRHGLDGVLTSQSTPLAGSMCRAADTLLDDLAARTGSTGKIYVASDGAENTTPVGHVCKPDSTSQGWKDAVTAYYRQRGLPALDVDLFDHPLVTGFAARRIDPEPAPARSEVASATATQTLDEFFAALTSLTGGRFRHIRDDQPLPRFADLSGDHCVDLDDAWLVAQRFGQRTPNVDPRFDLDRNGVITFADYLIVLSRIEGCAGPAPYTPAAPIVCHGADEIVLDGRSLETPGTAIEVRGSCRVTVRNSLIVAGQDAFHVTGSAEIVVENSFVAAAGALVDKRGSVRLTASGSQLKGPIRGRGAWVLDDRGGNRWY
jgi:hypothetical protein